jgi:glutaredoxin
MKSVSRILLPLALLFYIGVETWLKLHRHSLCGTSGCRLAGELLRFDAIYLDFTGIAVALFLTMLGYWSFSRKNAENLFFSVLYAAIISESVMIGYQSRVNPDICFFCLGVYVILLLTAFAAKPRFFIGFIPAIASVFMALGILDLPSNKALIDSDSLYLIRSEKCPHCNRVKSYFEQKRIKYHLLPVSDPAVRQLAKNLGIKTVPVLIAKKGDILTVISGDTPIIEYFENTTSAASSGSAQNLSGSSILQNIYTNSAATGCSLYSTDASGCGESRMEPKH